MDCWNWKGLAPLEMGFEEPRAAKGSGLGVDGAFAIVDEGRGVEEVAGAENAGRPPNVLDEGGAVMQRVAACRTYS